jgi:hypothetical protein
MVANNCVTNNYFIYVANIYTIFVNIFISG